MRTALLLVTCAVLAVAADPPRAAVEAVEFPYYAYPRSLWERELVWLKTIGVRTVAFSIPWNWHQPEPGAPDFTGRTSPRRDLMALVRLLRRLEMAAWVRPLPPVRRWVGGGYPHWAGQDRRASRAWLRELERLLEPQTAAHGGPLAYVEGAAGFLELPAPPAPVTLVSATGAGALARSRQALGAGRGALVWEDVETVLYPAGWEPAGAALVRHGAISLNGDEAASIAALRRNAALMKNWAPLTAHLRPRGKPAVRPAVGRFPGGVSAHELVSAAASAVSIINRGGQSYKGDLRVWDPATRRTMAVPGVEVPAGESLWLPVSVSLGGGGLCRECAGLAATERIVYATAELETIEYENGLLAMEFAAPVAGEVVLELSRQPSGPYLAAGHPTKYDFDEKTGRARLPVPAGKGAAHRVRVGLAIEPPEMSAFFVEARRLIIGRRNLVSTSYSSEQLAQRSRLRLPEGWTAKPAVKSPLEIDYEIDVPAEALHGDWANLAIEADGVLLGRARLQLFRPASVRLAQAMRLHFGQEELPVEPPVAAVDPRAGRNLDFTILNNSPQIQTYQVALSGPGFQFFPPRSEISIGAVMERAVAIRPFADEGLAGLNEARLRVSGGASVEMPVRMVVIPRGRTVAWSADLDGDGSPEWVLESQHARAVFSTEDGGRWLEFVYKDSDLNLLPDGGAYAGVGPAVVRVLDGGKLEMATSTGTRTVTLTGTALTVEQSTPLAPETLKTEKRNEVTLEVSRESPKRAVYTLVK